MINTRERNRSPRASRGVLVTATLALGLALVAGTASPVAAQISMPSITAPKQAANRAVAATNAHTAAMQNVDNNTPAAPAAAASAAAAPHAQATPIKLSTPATNAPAKGAPAADKPVMSVASHPAAAADGKGDAKGPTPAAGAKTTAGAAVPATSAVATKGGAPAAAAGPGAVGDSAGNSISVTQRGVKGEVSLNREVFSYDQGARRDPFISLMRSGDLRPMLSDLRLVAVLYDATGQNSIAVLRDQSNKDQYRARVGTTMGRMRVMQIQPKQVVFTIEEVGFSRQETLALGDTTKARTP
jgi:hypothetical protein